MWFTENCLPQSYFYDEAQKLAPRLLGCVLVRRDAEGMITAGRIVETEAYSSEDAASHSYRGITPRNAPMFGPPGYSYVYFTYGMHHCFNVTAAREGMGEAVLLRALEPLAGLEQMALYRSVSLQHPRALYMLCSGPGKLCQAMGLNRDFNRTALFTLQSGLWLAPPENSGPFLYDASPRIGISEAAELPWRFTLRENGFLSRPARPALPPADNR